VVSRSLDAAIDEEHNRHRCRVEPSTITQRRMTLDLVLAYADRVWNGTEREKVALFTVQYHVDRARLPATTYRARHGSEAITVRHFVERFPVSVEPHTSAVTLTYVSRGEWTAAGFATCLRAYAPLVAQLPPVVVLYVSTRDDWGDRAAGLCGAVRAQRGGTPLLSCRRRLPSISGHASDLKPVTWFACRRENHL
jgi:hypothetical protein